MKWFNASVFLAALTISGFFLGSVFLSLQVKEKRNEIESIRHDIEEIKLDIKRYKIEIVTLSGPKRVLSYIVANKLQPISLEKVVEISIDTIK